MRIKMFKMQYNRVWNVPDGGNSVRQVIAAIVRRQQSLPLHTQKTIASPYSTSQSYAFCFRLWCRQMILIVMVTNQRVNPYTPCMLAESHAKPLLRISFYNA
jgi:hypothetical protein